MYDFELFSNAAKHLEAGWEQETLEGPLGVCLVGSVLKAAGVSTDPGSDANANPYIQDKIFAIDKALSQRIGYRLMRWFFNTGPDFMTPYLSICACVERWNDAPWRRRSTVIKLMSDLAEEHKTAWLEDERSRLMIEINNLKADKNLLEARIARLEDENRKLWKRLTDGRSLEIAKQSLVALDQELSIKFAKIEEFA